MGRTSRLKRMPSGTLFSAAASGPFATKPSQHTAGNSRFNIASIFMGASIVGVYAGGAGGGSGHGGTGSDRFPRSDPLWMVRHQHGRWQGESGARVQFRS